MLQDSNACIIFFSACVYLYYLLKYRLMSCLFYFAFWRQSWCNYNMAEKLEILLPLIELFPLCCIGGLPLTVDFSPRFLHVSGSLQKKEGEKCDIVSGSPIGHRDGKWVTLTGPAQVSKDAGSRWAALAAQSAHYGHYCAKSIHTHTHTLVSRKSAELWRIKAHICCLCVSVIYHLFFVNRHWSPVLGPVHTYHTWFLSDVP